MYNCTTCSKSFSSVMSLTGHKRMHGQSNGKSKKIVCSCLITREVMPYQYLDQHQARLVECKQCTKMFKPSSDRKLFCSQSCSATHNNKVYVKRKKINRPEKIGKVKKIYTEQEKKAKNVEAVQAYRSRKYKATPSDTDRVLIRKIYENCPSGYEVDHIVALASGGNHHQDNLQYLPALENRRKNKSQKYDKSLVIQWQTIIA